MSQNELNSIIKFDQVIAIHADGEITDDVAGLWAPDVRWSDGHIIDMCGYHDWTLGPLMHDSEFEFVAEALEEHMRKNPGYYACVAVISDDEGEYDDAGWVVAYKPLGKAKAA
jgi:hypothetical protein